MSSFTIVLRQSYRLYYSMKSVVISSADLHRQNIFKKMLTNMSKFGRIATKTFVTEHNSRETLRINAKPEKRTGPHCAV